jgi:hypothetical protein
VGLEVGLAEAVPDGRGVGVGEVLGDAVTVGRADGVGDPLPVGDALAVGLSLGGVTCGVVEPVPPEPEHAASSAAESMSNQSAICARCIVIVHLPVWHRRAAASETR